MRVKFVMGLSATIIVAATSAALAQGTVRPVEPPTPFSLIYSNQMSTIATISCITSGVSPKVVEIPILLFWEQFRVLRIRKGTPTVYEAVGIFDKNTEKLTGEHFTAQGKVVSGVLRVEIKYTTDGKTWQTRQFPSQTSLSCP